MFHVLAELKAGDREGRGRTIRDALQTVGSLQPRSTVRVTITWDSTKGRVRVSGATLHEAKEAFIDELTKDL